MGSIEQIWDLGVSRFDGNLVITLYIDRFSTEPPRYSAGIGVICWKLHFGASWNAV